MSWYDPTNWALFKPMEYPDASGNYDPNIGVDYGDTGTGAIQSFEDYERQQTGYEIQEAQVDSLDFNPFNDTEQAQLAAEQERLGRLIVAQSTADWQAQLAAEQERLGRLIVAQSTADWQAQQASAGTPGSPPWGLAPAAANTLAQLAKDSGGVLLTGAPGASAGSPAGVQRVGMTSDMFNSESAKTIAYALGAAALGYVAIRALKAA